MDEPTADDVAAALARALASAPGPDGLPYSAWQRAGAPATQVLLRLHRHMECVGQAPPAFGASVAVFLPKGAQGEWGL